MKKNKIKILSLNGGGVRGLFTISVLAEIERILEEKDSENNVKIGEYFDLITGTSIGGILALGLASGKSARELERTFSENAPKIFPKQYFPTIRQAFGALYKSEPLKNAIISMLDENLTFNDLKYRVMIPTVNLSTGKPQFFKTPHNPDFTRDGRLKIIDAAMATSAAPTYFHPHYCEDLEAYFADGGLVANNPSFIGLHEVFRDMTSDFPDVTVQSVQILNIGTLGANYAISPSKFKDKWNKGYSGLWGMGKNLVLTTMTANEHLQREMLRRELRSHGCESNYLSLDDIVPNEAASDITLDNASLGSLTNLKSRGKQIVSEQYSQNEILQNFFLSKAKPFKN